MLYRLGRWLAFSLAGILVAAAAAAEPLPIFDTHVHYNRPAWDGLKPDRLKRLVRSAGVTRALVSSTPDDGTLKLHAYDPEMFVPELRPYHGKVNSVNWHAHAETIPYLEARLAKTKYVGIGEFHFYPGREPITPVVRRVVELAVEKGILLHVHSSAEPVRRLFALDERLIILWAHAGMSEPPDVVGPMLDEFPRLFAELSFRAEDITDGLGNMNPHWKALLERHANRFTIGSDTYENERWASFGDLIGAHRHWLDQLPKDAARAIAFDNAVRLFAAR